MAISNQPLIQKKKCPQNTVFYPLKLFKKILAPNVSKLKKSLCSIKLGNCIASIKESEISNIFGHPIVGERLRT